MTNFELDLYFLMTYPYVNFELNVLNRLGDNEQKLEISYYFQCKKGITLPKIIEPWPISNLTCIFSWHIHMSHLSSICARVIKIMNGNWWWRKDGMTEWRNRITLYAPAIIWRGHNKKGHNSVKMLDRVTSSCLHVGVMIVNKCAKFQSHMSMDFENIWGITKTLT
jgi:hypothetical protein